MKLKKQIKEKSFKKGVKARLNNKFFPTRTYLIEMINSNGTISHFVIKSDINKFKHKKKTYALDEKRKTYSATTKLYMLRYHEDYALPFSVNVAAPELREASRAKLPEIDTSFNPFILGDILDAHYAKGVAQSGSSMEKAFKSITIFLVINMLLAAANAIISLRAAGWI